MADSPSTVSTATGAHVGATVLGSVAYEDALARDLRWAMGEASEFFEGKGRVQASLRKVTSKLDELGIPYAVAGGMALFVHGFRRFTEDVDILVTRDGLTRLHRELDGLGYVRPFEKSKNLRDAEFGVRIEFLVAGDYPGDGKPKPVAFPDPATVAEVHDGIKYVGLPTLVNLKLASGMSHPHRGKDLTDVEELIKTLHLPKEFEDSLHPYVRDKFRELWRKLEVSPTRYVTLWRNKGPTAEAKSIEDMIAALKKAVTTLESMLADGVTLDPQGGTSDDYVYLVTTDRLVAEKYGMVEESEFFDDDETATEEDH